MATLCALSLNLLELLDDFKLLPEVHSIILPWIPLLLGPQHLSHLGHCQVEVVEPGPVPLVVTNAIWLRDDGLHRPGLGAGGAPGAGPGGHAAAKGFLK